MHYFGIINKTKNYWISFCKYDVIITKISPIHSKFLMYILKHSEVVMSRFCGYKSEECERCN